jgi:transcriptional regulator with XRE-family HTH domain
MREKELRNILSINIKRFRKHKKWTQADLAEKSEISTNFLSDIETGKKWPYPGTLTNIARAFNIEVYTLFMPKESSPNEIAAQIRKYKDDAIVLISESLENLCKTCLSEKE